MISKDLFKQYASSDYFFYYQNIDFRDMCKHDLLELLSQPARSMYFFSKYGAGIKNFENFPTGFIMRIGITYGIANAIAKRNTFVTDGSGGTPDRRIATSQEAVEYEQGEMGNLDVSVFYFLFADLKKQDNIKLSTGAI